MMFRKIQFVVLFLIISSATFLSAQSEITRSVFIPPEYYIGDPVELRLQLELDRSEVLSVPLNIDEPEWVEIQDIQINLQFVYYRFFSRR